MDRVTASTGAIIAILCVGVVLIAAGSVHSSRSGMAASGAGNIGIVDVGLMARGQYHDMVVQRPAFEGVPEVRIKGVSPTSGCPCIRVTRFPATVIEGEQWAIDLSVSVTQPAGPLRESLVVDFEDEEMADQVIEVVGMVYEPGPALATGELSFGGVDRGGSDVVRRVQILNDPGPIAELAWRIVRVSTDMPDVEAEMNGEREIRVTLLQQDATGEHAHGVVRIEYEQLGERHEKLIRVNVWADES